MGVEPGKWSRSIEPADIATRKRNAILFLKIISQKCFAQNKQKNLIHKKYIL